RHLRDDVAKQKLLERGAEELLLFEMKRRKMMNASAASAASASTSTGAGAKMKEVEKKQKKSSDSRGSLISRVIYAADHEPVTSAQRKPLFRGSKHESPRSRVRKAEGSQGNKRDLLDEEYGGEDAYLDLLRQLTEGTTTELVHGLEVTVDNKVQELSDAQRDKLAALLRQKSEMERRRLYGPVEVDEGVDGKKIEGASTSKGGRGHRRSSSRRSPGPSQERAGGRSRRSSRSLQDQQDHGRRKSAQHPFRPGAENYDYQEELAKANRRTRASDVVVAQRTTAQPQNMKHPRASSSSSSKMQQVLEEKFRAQEETKRKSISKIRTSAATHSRASRSASVPKGRKKKDSSTASSSLTGASSKDVDVDQQAKETEMVTEYEQQLPARLEMRDHVDDSQLLQDHAEASLLQQQVQQVSSSGRNKKQPRSRRKAEGEVQHPFLAESGDPHDEEEMLLTQLGDRSPQLLGEFKHAMAKIPDVF
ncbi:unnamed protein product, partial [Amoebophrya sp. A120]